MSLGVGAAVLAAASLCLPIAAGGADGVPGPTEARGSFSSFPDYMDPQLAYTSEGWTAMYDTYIPLLTYRHASGKAGSEIIPGLAKSLPRISDGGRKYTLVLRKGLRYSNGKPVKATDFEHAVERLFKLFSGGSVFYTDIVGARHYMRTRRGDIGGIVANDRSGRIVIRLVRPKGDFIDALALMFAAPVPPGTPDFDQTTSPPPGTGPYVITGSKPGLGWSYFRNPQWAPHNARMLPQLPSGHLDKIQIAVIPNAAEQVSQVEEGKLDFMFSPAPGNRWAELEAKFGGTQFRAEPTLSTYYFWMNARKAPFDDVSVRRAVNYALDRSALQRIYLGQILPTQQVLPPFMPGYKKLDLYPHNLAKARRLIVAAHPRDREITAWTDNESPNDKAGAYYASVLRKLGFKVHLKVLNADSYFAQIGATSTANLDTGFANWFEDYPHPNDFFHPLLSGSSIFPFYNSNFGQVDVPSLNRRIGALSKVSGPVPQARYAALDRSYMRLASLAPYGTRMLSSFVSSTVDLNKLVWNPTFGQDLTSLQFK
jgi:peptide/nickel transport system substrate-binding protein